VEAYYQEAGRGGRDGRAAECLVLWRREDFAWGNIAAPMRRYVEARGTTAQSFSNTSARYNLDRPRPPSTVYIFLMHDSLYFSDHHLQVREMVRDFAKKVVRPSARQYDLDSRFPGTM